eukprot:212206-Prymnesium_polylepis.1
MARPHRRATIVVVACACAGAAGIRRSSGGDVVLPAVEATREPPMRQQRVRHVDVLTEAVTNWSLWTDETVTHTPEYEALRSSGAFGNESAAEYAFSVRAEAIKAKHLNHTLEMANALTARWGAGRVLEGRIDPWNMLQRLAYTVDLTDVTIYTTHQWLHTMQVFEGMVADGVTDSGGGGGARGAGAGASLGA